MNKGREGKPRSRLRRCERAMAVPITFLILFVSLMLIIIATYYVAITQISARGQLLNFYAAKQYMISLENNINSILWSTGASHTFYLSDFGGNLRIAPAAKALLVNVTDNAFLDTSFSSPVGEAVYQLANAEPGQSGLYLKGDARSIVNSSTSTMTQLKMTTGETTQEIVLSYRPLASSTVTGSDGDRPVNSVRIYIVSMNLSQTFTLYSGYVRAKCAGVVSDIRSYSLSYPLTSLQVKVVLAGVNGAVSLPISSSPSGAIVSVEVLVCSIQLERIGV